MFSVYRFIAFTANDCFIVPFYYLYKSKYKALSAGRTNSIQWRTRRSSLLVYFRLDRHSMQLRGDI